MPDANTLFNIAERRSGSFGIALLATFCTAWTQVGGSPASALHDCALLLAAVSAGGALAAFHAPQSAGQTRRAGPADRAGPGPAGLPPGSRACDDGFGRQ